MRYRTTCLAVACLAAPSIAQTIYEPVVVQHGGQNSYYYAGSDPAIHAAAAFPSVPGAAWGRVNGFAFVGPNRLVVERRVRIYTDAFGTVDAGRYGLTPDQVVNEANARLPKYFRKSELNGELRNGVAYVAPTSPSPAVDVNALPKGSIYIRPSPPLQRRTPIYVFPRGLLGKKVGDIAAPAEKRV